MSVVNLTNIKILSNPSPFLSTYQFEIQFECLSPLEADLEFKIIYVGSAEDDSNDQELESIMVGPVPVGVNKFVFEADPPKINVIPKEDVLGVTVILVTCSYKEKEFVRVGYYVNVDYSEESLRSEPPSEIVWDKLMRNILADQPRVTRFSIPWDGEEEAVPIDTTEPQEEEIIEKEESEQDEDEEMDEPNEEEEVTAEVDLDDYDDEEEEEEENEDPNKEIDLIDEDEENLQPIVVDA